MAYQVQNLEERTSKAGHLHYIISLNGHGNMQAYGAEHQMIRSGGVRVGDFIEFEKGGKDGNFANKIRVVDPFADDPPAISAPVSAPNQQLFLSATDKSIICQVAFKEASIYERDLIANSHKVNGEEYDPARVVARTVDGARAIVEAMKSI